MTTYRNLIRVPPGTKQRFLILEQEASQALVKLGVRLSGIGTFGAEYRVGYHDPPSHLVLLTIDGGGFFSSAEAKFQTQSGELLISPAGVPMLLGTVERSWTFLWFYVQNLSRWNHLVRQPARTYSPTFSTQLRHAFEGLLAESGWRLSQSVLTEAGWVANRPQPIEPSSKVATLHGALVSEYLTRTLESPKKAIDPWQEKLDRMWQSVEQNPSEAWTQADMCRWLDASPAMLQRQSQRLYRTPPRQMLIQLRMTQARRLLMQTTYPLDIVAQQVGYSDGFVFSAAFKRVHGVNPQTFRQSTKGN